MELTKYRIVRSDRKSAAIEIKNEEIIVRVPERMPEGDIEKFVLQHRGWIEKHLRLDEERKKAESEIKRLTENDVIRLREQAGRVIPDRVRHFAAIADVNYGKITIRCQKTRWGSCSSKGNLSFNCLLMLTPPEVIDSVVVHELCHLKEMNHSERFYKEVLHIFPDYYRWNKWLKENGGMLIKRLPEK